MRPLEELMNSLTDMDWGWWPVVFLRPPKHKDMDMVVLLKMTCFFGPMTALVVLLGRFMRMGRATLSATDLLLCCVFFFVLYKFTFAIAWNRRAKRLRDAHDTA
jgi:hypothetical protein